MKFPREPTGNIHPLMRFYLTEEERNEKVHGKTRERALREIGAAMPSSTLVSQRKPLSQILQEVGRKDQNEWQKKMARVLEGTRIADTLAKPV